MSHANHLIIKACDIVIFISWHIGHGVAKARIFRYSCTFLTSKFRIMTVCQVITCNKKYPFSEFTGKITK